MESVVARTSLTPRTDLPSRLSLLLMLLLPCVAIAQVKPVVQITPGIYNIRLGNPIAEVVKTYPVKETEDLSISLYRKFGFGDPEKEERVNKKLGRQYYEISEHLPPDVKSIRLTTVQGIVYEIAVYYEPEYTKKMSWEVFTYHAIQKYGQPTITNELLDPMGGDYNFKWSDGTTELVIRKSGKLNKEKTIFSVENYHVFYTHVPTRNKVSKKEQYLRETETAQGTTKPSF